MMIIFYCEFNIRDGLRSYYYYLLLGVFINYFVGKWILRKYCDMKRLEYKNMGRKILG